MATVGGKIAKQLFKLGEKVFEAGSGAEAIKIAGALKKTGGAAGGAVLEAFENAASTKARAGLGAAAGAALVAGAASESQASTGDASGTGENSMATDPFAEFEQVAPGQAASSGSAGAADPFAEFEQVDPAAAQRPQYANGLSPATPINETPSKITPAVRQLLSFGDEKGTLSKLNELGFSDVKKFGDSFSVKDPEDGLYKTINPTVEADNAWDATKNILKAAGSTALFAGAAINAPIIAGINAITGSNIQSDPVTNAAAASKSLFGKVGEETVATIGENYALGANIAAGIATGGASLPAQIALAGLVGGAVEAGRVSLGRLEGTYSATDEDMLKDSAFEALINLGGGAIALGAAPTLKYLAKNGIVKGIGAAVKSMTPESLAAVKATFGAQSEIADASFDTMLKNSDAVNTLVASKSNVSKYSDFVDALTERDIATIQESGDGIRRGISQIYGEMKSKVTKLAGPEFKADPSALVSDVVADLHSMGFIKATEAAGDSLSDAANFRIASRAEMLKSLESSPNKVDVLRLINDPKSYMSMRRAADQVLGIKNQKLTKVGEEAVSDMMTIKSILGDMTNTIRSAAQQGDNNLPAVARKMAEYNSSVDSKFQSLLPTDEARTAFKGLNSSYSDAKEIAEPLLQAASDPNKARQIVQAYRSQSTASTLNRTAMARLQSHISDQGGAAGASLAKTLGQHLDSLDVTKAALDFSKPAERAMGIGSVGAAFGVGAATSPLGGLALAGAQQALKTPSIALKAANAQLKVNAFIRSIPRAQIPRALENPEFMATLGRIASDSVASEIETQNELLTSAGVK